MCLTLVKAGIVQFCVDYFKGVVFEPVLLQISEWADGVVIELLVWTEASFN